MKTVTLESSGKSPQTVLVQFDGTAERVDVVWRGFQAQSTRLIEPDMPIYLQSEIRKWQVVVKTAGVTPE